MRGAVELPAVVIFTVVAGSLIILFFILLSTSQSEAAQRSTQARDLQGIDTLLKSSVTQSETQNNITVVDDTLVYTCDATGAYFGYDNDMRLPLFTLVTFSPHRLPGGVLHAYSAGVDHPYPAFNVLYLDSPENTIEATPAALTEIGAYPFTLADRSTRTGIRLVYLHGVDVAPASTEKIESIEIYPAMGKQYGQVIYHRNGVDTALIYLNQQTLWGAIVSDTPQTYACSLGVYLEQLRFVNAVQRERARNLRDAYTASLSSCASLYQDFPFADIDRVSAGYLPASGLTLQDATDLATAAGQIAYMKDALLRGDRCASLY